MEAISLSRHTASDISQILGNRRQGTNGWYNCSCPCAHNHAHGDKTPSLGLRDGEDGNLIAKCQTGCNPRDIYQALRAMGISFYETAFTKQKHAASVAKFLPKQKQHGNLIAEYHYVTEDAELIVTKQRYEPKDFLIHPRGQSSKYVLYNLPHIKLARENGWVVYLCEGEKDADKLTELQLVATCNIEGASLGEVKWRDSYTQALIGLDVVIFADNDEAGINQARGVAARLNGKAASVKVVEFPELPEKGDVSDYLANNTKEDLLARVEASSIYTPPTQVKRFEFTDMANAERLCHYHKDTLGYCEKWDSWMSYNGRVWRKGELLAVKKAQETVRLILQEGELNNSEEHQTKVCKHYAHSQKASAIKGMLYLARASVTQIEPSQLDVNPDLFNVSNGTINLKTGVLRPHDRNDLISKCSPIAYNPEAKAPRWERFLAEVFQENTELIEYVQRALGYSITGHASERAFFILHGIGRNGKSTLVETLSHIIGDDYSLGMPSESLYSKKNDGGVPNDIARLRGSRFVYSSEGEDGKHLAVAKIKQLTGNEKITSRHMRGEWFDFMANFKIWFSTNHKPEISESAEAIWDRVKLIPFNKRFSDEEKDPLLRQTLIGESAGILNWCLDGARKWYEQGLGDCSIVKAATSDYRKDSDLVGRFLEECCEHGQAKEIQSKKLYERFEQWTKEQGLPQAMSSVAFSKRLQEKGLQKLMRTGGRWYWQELDVTQFDDNLPKTGW